MSASIVTRRLGRAAALAALVAPGALLLPAVACGPRAVQVSSGPEPAAAGLSFTNHLQTAVNVYVQAPGSGEIFVRQVPAGATEALVVHGVSPGSLVSMRAAPVDGGPPFKRDGVALGTGAAWTVP